LASTASDRKGCQNSAWYFMILSINNFFKHQNKVIFVIKLSNARTWLTLKNSLVIFLASDTYAASLTSAASETSKAIFPQKTSGF
jgi:hypothetical protein